MKRMAEAKARPAAIASLKEVLNMSAFFVEQMKNFSNNSNYSKEVEKIFTEVEINTLETLSNETRVCSYIRTYVQTFVTGFAKEVLHWHPIFQF